MEIDDETMVRHKFSFSGKYKKNLMEEVSNYAIVASVIARKHDYDLIHSHDWLTYPAGIAAKAATGKPFVIHVHATEFDRSGENVNQSVYDIEKAGMEAADKVITVSNMTRKIVIEKYGINPGKVVTVHNAVEPTLFKKNVDSEKHVNEKIVTFLGRITFQKGPEYFVETAHKVLQKDPNVRFVMAGSGDMMNKIVLRVAQLGISNKFHFTGFLRGDDVDRMFHMSDVYVMPSVSEPFGISPLEAMRSNVPVVISKQSGVSEILKHALKVDFWDIEATADAIYGLLQYSALPKMFIKHGKSEVDNIKWDNSAIKVKKVYQDTLMNFMNKSVT
jgi:glycosyltransferase involved in cell wall biosynthesis